MVTMLSERLLLAMRQKGFSKADLSRKAFVSRATVTEWCNGGIQTLSHANLDRVAKALEVDPRWLAYGETVTMPKSAQSVDATTEIEKKLVQAFSLLLDSQKESVVNHVLALAEQNRMMLAELLTKYGDAVPDNIVSKHLPPAPDSDT